MRPVNEETLRDFIRRHNIPVKGEESKGGTTKIILQHCVFDETHTGKDAAIIIRGGNIGYKCFHDSCKGKNIGDFFKKYEPDFYRDSAFTTAAKSEKKIVPMLRRMQDVEEKEAEWLIPGYIPKGSMTLLAGDGGTGKTFIWCNLVAAVTTGKKSILEQEIPFPVKGEGKDVLFFSSEDSAEVVLCRRLRKAGANLARVQFVDMIDPAFETIKFNSQELADIVEQSRPALCVFDPLQSFIPPTVNMASRNAMRQCTAALATLGTKYGTAFLIILHTNKKQAVSGRTRIADSADMWDASRSVLMTGRTEEKGVMYLSHEKSNYSELQNTVLYSIAGETLEYHGTTEKRDADFMREMATAQRPAPSREDAKDKIIEFLKNDEWHPTAALDESLLNNGVSKGTLIRAKRELKESGRIMYKVEGFSPKTFYVRLRANAGI